MKDWGSTSLGSHPYYIWQGFIKNGLVNASWYLSTGEIRLVKLYLINNLQKNFCGAFPRFVGLGVNKIVIGCYFINSLGIKTPEWEYWLFDISL